jgi:putative transposase
VDGESTVRKGYHCAWQIHYHIALPVKYRKILLDEEVVRIIRETTVGIEERYEIEMEMMGMDRNHRSKTSNNYRFSSFNTL